MNNYFVKYGDFFGETLLFKTKGFNSFGRIRTCTDVVYLKLSRFDFNKIPTLDVIISFLIKLKIMEYNCTKR